MGSGSFGALLFFAHLCPGKWLVFSIAGQEEGEGYQDDQPGNTAPEHMDVMQGVPYRLFCKFCERNIKSASKAVHT
eukprot:scaffold772_cov339-Pavlova_lutheri.AAC.13